MGRSCPRSPGGEYRLVGDTSFGRACAKPRFPGIYARLAADPMRTTLELGIRELFGADVVAGSTTPRAAAARSAAASAKAAAYAEGECDYYGRICRRAEVISCTPQGSGYRCLIADPPQGSGAASPRRASNC